MLRLGALVFIGLALFGPGLAAPAVADDALTSSGPALAAPGISAARMQLAQPARYTLRPPQRPTQMPLTPTTYAPERSLRPVRRDTWAVPRLHWDGHPRGPRWSAAVMAALRGPGAPLLDVVPRDIAQWCPGYPLADAEQRAAFWAGLVSTLAFHESTHDPAAVGGGGQWFGLVQIAPGTARWRNCAVGTGDGLLDGPANLRCGIRIMAATVPRDGVVAEGMRGVAADWGPFHSDRKREDMRNWVRSQDYCQTRTRPVMRPLPPGDAVAHAGYRPIPRPGSPPVAPLPWVAQVATAR